MYQQKCQKTHIPASSLHKYRKFCLKLICPFYGLLQLYEQKCHETHISAISLHKNHKFCFKLIRPF